MSCIADRWFVRLTGYDDADVSAIRRAKSLSVTGEQESTLCIGAPEDVSIGADGGVECCTVTIADGADFCQGRTSVAVKGGTTLDETIHTLLAHCDSPLPLVTLVTADNRLARGQALFGRTVRIIRTIAKSAGYRAYVTRGGLYLRRQGEGGEPLTLTDEMMLETPAKVEGAAIVYTPMMGLVPGQRVILPGSSAAYCIVAQSIDADNYEGAWECQTVLLDETAMSAYKESDWGGIIA